MRHDNFIPTLTRIASRGRLPHWQADNAIYSITFRLADSLPRDIACSLLLEREHLIRSCQTAAERARVDEAFFVRLDHELDQGYGSCILRAHGDLVATALRHFDAVRYMLHAWCVMPNHVHVMVYVEHGETVPEILHSWKSYTAHEIGRGRIWQREYFDRIVRSPQDYQRTAAYIRANPARAGLKEWRWVG